MAQRLRMRAAWPMRLDPEDRIRSPAGPHVRATLPLIARSIMVDQSGDKRIGSTILCKHIFCAAVGGKQSNPPAGASHHATPALHWIDDQAAEIVKVPQHA
jgi:hypothetical protein